MSAATDVVGGRAWREDLREGATLTVPTEESVSEPDLEDGSLGKCVYHDSLSGDAERILFS